MGGASQFVCPPATPAQSVSHARFVHGAAVPLSRGNGDARVSMFTPSSVNVICFDPNHNSDQARGYAAKYCSKPEKWWAPVALLENRAARMRSCCCSRARVAPVLHGNAAGKRLEGLAAGTSRWAVHDLGAAPPTPHRPEYSGGGVDATEISRAPGVRVASDRRPSIKSAEVPGSKKLRQLHRQVSVQARRSILRPVEVCSGGATGLFRCARNKQLRHLRIEQFNRYLSLVDCGRAGEETMEDTIDEDTPENPYKIVNKCHRHWDATMENTPAGTTFKATQPGISASRRRSDARLGVSRLAFLEPIGPGRRMRFVFQHSE